VPKSIDLIQNNENKINTTNRNINNNYKQIENNLNDIYKQIENNSSNEKEVKEDLYGTIIDICDAQINYTKRFSLELSRNVNKYFADLQNGIREGAIPPKGSKYFSIDEDLIDRTSGDKDKIAKLVSRLKVFKSKSVEESLEYLKSEKIIK